MHYLNLCPVRQFIGKLALKLFCHWCKATVSSILNNSLLCAYNQRFVLIVYVLGLLFLQGCSLIFFLFFASFQLLILPISGMDKLIEQFVKLNTKLNRKLQPRVRYFYIFIAFEMKSEIWVMSFSLSLAERNVWMLTHTKKNVRSFAV